MGKVHITDKGYSKRLNRDPKPKSKAKSKSNQTGITDVVSSIYKNCMSIDTDEDRALLADKVANQGYCIQTGIINPDKVAKAGNIADIVTEATFFALDFDNSEKKAKVTGKIFTIEDFKEKAREYEVPYLFIYKTRGYTDEYPRFRVIFESDCTLDNKRGAEMMMEMLHKIFPFADKLVKNLNKLIEGSINGLIEFNPSGRINLFEVGISVECILGEHQKSKRDLKNFSQKKLGLELQNGVLDIMKIEKSELGDVSEGEIVIGMNSDTPYCYILGGGALKRREKDASFDIIPAMEDLEEKLISECPLYRDYIDDPDDLDHSYKFHLATNLVFFTNARDMFLNHMTTHILSWKKQWKHIESRQRSPMNCKGDKCPYTAECNCTSLYHKFKKSSSSTIKYIGPEIEYQSVEKARWQLKQVTRDIIDSGDKSIHILIGQTGIGKTVSNCKTISEYYHNEGKTFIYACPTTDLQREIYNMLINPPYSVPAVCTVNISRAFRENGYYEEADKFDALYNRGLNKKVKSYVWGFYYKHIKALDPSFSKEIELWLNTNDIIAKGTQTVITTHKRLLTLSEDVEILEKYNGVIVDEDILTGIFCGTVSVSFEAVHKAMDRGIFIDNNEYQEILELPHGTIIKRSNDKDEGFVDRLIEKKLRVDENLPALVDADYILVDKGRKSKEGTGDRLLCFQKPELPDTKLIILSATADPDIYRDYDPFRTVEEHYINPVKYTGEVIQYPKYSMSRTCIESFGKEANGKEGFTKIVDTIRKMTDYPKNESIVTYKKYASANEMYFGHSQGSNKLKGRNIFVIGNAFLTKELYSLLGASMGYCKNLETPNFHKNIEFNGYRFNAFTFSNERLRHLQLYLQHTEIQQSVGRARVIDHNCKVWVFCGIPVEQAKFVFEDYLKELKNEDADDADGE